MVKKIISGGQTGADQGGLKAGIILGLEVGGWIPKGRRTENGPMSLDLFYMFHLEEHSSNSYMPRTETNVLYGDGTVLFGNMDSAGSRLTINLCKKNNKPYICNPTPEFLREFVEEYDIVTLNVAGNRESVNKGIEEATTLCLLKALGEAYRE